MSSQRSGAAAQSLGSVGSDFQCQYGENQCQYGENQLVHPPQRLAGGDRVERSAISLTWAALACGRSAARRVTTPHALTRVVGDTPVGDRFAHQ
jgi:hypothetical protein